jgi:hypothetical protein
VSLFEQLLTEQDQLGELTLSTSATTLAYGIVRIMEADFYADGVAGEKRDIARAVLLAGLLLPNASGQSPSARIFGSPAAPT